MKQKINGAVKYTNRIVPQHLAVIMDGNRRWARERNLPVFEGHRRVANEILERLVERASFRGIKYLTLWAFSTENWHRPKVEVRGIMTLLRRSIDPFGKRMFQKGVRLRVIGDLSRFDGDLQKRISDVVEKTKNNTRITVVLALNYGGRNELLRAVRNLLIRPIRQRADQPDQFVNKLTEEEFAKKLDTVDIPDPEIIVRTGGEQRLSGFLPWQSAYSEFYFPAWYMPEFTPEKLDEVIGEFNRRQRRFGK